MRATVEVKDLNPAQAAYLARQVPVNGREFITGIPRVCAVFELAEGVDLHVEMDVTELAALMVRLATIGLRATAEAALVETSGERAKFSDRPDQTTEPEPQCGHGARMTMEIPSVFEGAQPTRHYSDGCQSYGPYRGPDT